MNANCESSRNKKLAVKRPISFFSNRACGKLFVVVIGIRICSVAVLQSRGTMNKNKCVEKLKWKFA